MTTKYLKLQESAREIGCKLTKQREGNATNAPYYLHLKNGTVKRPCFTLDQVAEFLKTEYKRQGGYWSKGHKDLMRNPMRD